MTPGRGLLAVAVAIAAVTAVATVPGPVASAAPESPVNYPSGASATRTSGLGFDTCVAPTAARLRAWLASPMRTVNIYFGGINRGCPTQPNLTAAWTREVTAMGWRLLPTYVGYQPTCVYGTKQYRFAAADAAARGGADGADAATKAGALGLLPGSALYADVEHYDRSVPGCSDAVRSYVSAWTTSVHARGYLSGVYVHQDSGARDLAASYGSTSLFRPDAVWMARWDGAATLTGWPTVGPGQWAVHQRLKQYRGDHAETWGGVTLTIDSDVVDAPVATVAQSYTVTSRVPLAARSGPGTQYPLTRALAPRSTVSVVCQGLGQKVGTTQAWDRLVDGSWVTDYYLSTPSKTTWSKPLPLCTYPGQVTAPVSLVARSGPGTGYPAVGAALPSGALAYVLCQRGGSLVGRSPIWNRLDDGRYVSDYYVSNRSSASYSAPVPRC
jgi:uncharacterized protein YraI